MALDALSGATYRDAARVSVNPGISEAGSSQDSRAASMNITEGTAKVQRGSQNGKDQNNGLKDEAVSDKKIKNAISKANSTLKRTRCEFSYDEATKRVSIKVLDRDTEEVIKEIPPEETLEMVEKMWELVGLLVDERR